MNWDKAPREPKPSELLGCVGLVVTYCLLLSNNRPWWVWVLGIVAAVSAVIGAARYFRDKRVYQAWQAWDEAGGPDASSHTPPRR